MDNDERKPFMGANATTAIKSCADCKHMKSWMEYGNVVLDCCHKEGSSYYEQYADETLDAGPHCPYWEDFNIGDINPWGGEPWL